jgi:hypothetical protein
MSDVGSNGAFSVGGGGIGVASIGILLIRFYHVGPPVQHNLGVAKSRHWQLIGGSPPNRLHAADNLAPSVKSPAHKTFQKKLNFPVDEFLKVY